MLLDTIIAPATTLVKQAISIIRISGLDAYKIINQIFSKAILKKGNQVHFGYIKDGAQEIDQVILVCFEGPSSFTGEDVIEINCHGGVLVTNKIIMLLLKNGARLAERGEFSQRAFLNGKINLVQAEAINDLVNATNDNSLKLAVNNLQNKNITVLQEFRQDLLDIIANIEVNIDYPEYDGVGDLTSAELGTLLIRLFERIEDIIAMSKIGKIINDGINLLILGQPNVGKSSLLNALLNEEKAIVSDLPGTTRDIVEGRINIGSLTLNVIDTAGIRKTNNEIEQIGIDKAIAQIKEADLVLIVADISQGITIEEEKLINLAKNKQKIIVFNKNDLVINKNKVGSEIPAVYISALNRDIKALITKINNLYNTDQIFKEDSLVLTNINQISLLDKVAILIKNAYNNIVSGFPVDIVNVDLHEAWELLGMLMGENYEDNLLDTMFGKYCLGK